MKRKILDHTSSSKRQKILEQRQLEIILPYKHNQIITPLQKLQFHAQMHVLKFYIFQNKIPPTPLLEAAAGINIVENMQAYAMGTESEIHYNKSRIVLFGEI